MENIRNIIGQLQSTSGRNDKIAILTENKGNGLWTEVLKFLLDPMVVTGMSMKKIEKYQNEDPALPGYDSLLDVLAYLRVHNTGTMYDVFVVRSFVARYPEHRDWLLQLFTKSLKLGVDTSTVNKVYGKNFIHVFTVMLAETLENFPHYLDGKDFTITQKLDGVRCVAFVYGNGEVKFFTRNGQEYGEVPDVADDLRKISVTMMGRGAGSIFQGVAYDGELIAVSKSSDTGEVFRQTVSTANSKGVKRGLVYHVFDRLPISNFFDGFYSEPCSVRKKLLGEDIKHTDGICWVENVEVLYEGRDQEKINEWAAIAQERGWEGLMLNNAAAPYQAKRVRDLLKVKKFKTEDVRVVGVFEGEGALAGTLGGVNVEFEVDGKMYTSKCGSGFTREQRDKYWADPDLLIGKIVTLKCFEVSADKDGGRSLRFPIWLDIIRFDKDDTSVE